MDLLKSAENILKEKKLNVTNENVKEVMEQLEKKRKKRYSAVCIGIDGTLEDVNELSDEMLTIIYDLLNKHIPIVLITGRGERGLKEFYKRISIRLIEQKHINKELIKNIIAVTNNGEILFYTSEMEKEQDEDNYLDKYKLLVEEEDLREISDVKEHLMTFFYENSDVSFSDSIFSTLNNKLMGFRIIIKNKEDKDKIKRFMDFFISVEKKRNPKSKICCSFGKYKEKDIFQVDIGDKAKAMKEIESFLGIPENSMLRIGDQGSEQGNDFSMLDCFQGYCVDECSQDIKNCYPVCDDNGNILKGIEATKYLLTHAKLFPTICLKKPDKQRYTRQLSIAERNIKRGKREIIRRYNSIINDVFNISDGFEEVFDKKSGAIVFDDWEWNLIDDNNELKQLFNQNEKGSYKYSLDTDTSKLLRGVDTYYYFLANKLNEEPDSDLIMSWYINYMDFFKSAYSILSNYKIKNIPSDLKLLLGVLDNIRNVALINLNASIITEYPDSHILLSLDTYLQNGDIKDWFNICNQIYDQMEILCFNTGKAEYCVEETGKILERVLKKFPESIRKILEREDLKLNKRCFRTYREIDNFIENYITMNLSIQNIKNENKDLLDREINFSGLLYGGMELPLLAKIILSKEQYNIDTSIIMVKKDSYDEMHSEGFFDRLMKQGIAIKSKRNYERGFNVVSDDNVLTGVTLQTALELLFEKDIYVNNLAVVRYPSINRVEHMFSGNRGAIDTTKFTTYIKGLIFPSPYSKIRNGEDYLDELGVFNKSRERILQYLYKNGRFSKNSEVDRIANRIRKQGDDSR